MFPGGATVVGAERHLFACDFKILIFCGPVLSGLGDSYEVFVVRGQLAGDECVRLWVEMGADFGGGSGIGLFGCDDDIAGRVGEPGRGGGVGDG